MATQDPIFAQPLPRPETMRLTIIVHPLPDKAAGQDRFALPVRADDTFEEVWTKIEQHYQRIYPQKAR